jgi:hypothetical protein
MFSLLLALVSALLAVLSLPLLHHETVRAYDCYQRCRATFAENERHLLDPACADPWVRSTKGAKQEALCQRAADENRVPPFLCAGQMLAREGQVARAWELIVGSPWMLLALVCFIVWAVLSACMERCRHRETLRTQREFLRTLTSAAASSSSASFPGMGGGPRIEVLEEEDDVPKIGPRERKQQRGYGTFSIIEKNHV